MKLKSPHGNKAIAKAKLDNNSEFKDLIFWEVDIYGANIREASNEITVNFMSLAINNKEIFYTDSNGMKMMKRILNYR